VSLVLEREALAQHLAEWRVQSPDCQIVLANGCFDLLHVGHLRYLESARAEGSHLVVALNDDPSVRSLKGPERPRVPLRERAELDAGLRCVNAVTWFGETTVEATLRCLRPDVHAKGTDYTPETVPERHVDAELGIRIAICGDPKDHHSSSF